MIEHCKSERGYTSAGRILALVLASLTTVWARDYRSVNADVWKSEGVHYSGLSQRMNTHHIIYSSDWKKHHHEKWGGLFEAKDVKVGFGLTCPEKGRH